MIMTLTFLCSVEDDFFMILISNVTGVVFWKELEA